MFSFLNGTLGPVSALGRRGGSSDNLLIVFMKIIHISSVSGFDSQNSRYEYFRWIFGRFPNRKPEPFYCDPFEVNNFALSLLLFNMIPFFNHFAAVLGNLELHANLVRSPYFRAFMVLFSQHLASLKNSGYSIFQFNKCSRPVFL